MSGAVASVMVLNPGAYTSVQDRGRVGLRRVGVPWSGALHRERQGLANALVGNPAEGPLLEHFDGGLQLQVAQGPVVVAVGGEAEVEIARAGVTRRAACWRSYVLAAEDRVRVRRTLSGRLVYVAIGALRVPTLLRSASTYARAGIGRALVTGDLLQAGEQRAGERELDVAPGSDPAPIRVVPGPQAGHFTRAALEALVQGGFTVTEQADRMGVRLRGNALEHRSPAHREIVSDATVPGSIQVPGNGQPIVLLADAQTAGGYPKIATVISADLGRLADCRPGTEVRFAVVSVEEAERAARAHAAGLATRIGRIRRVAGDGHVDLERLYDGNLVSGMISAHAETE
ncbi:MAG TPA: biotin-dependent carboxyltransferase family protein [Gammaproteobacteria bacterium]